MLLQSLTNRRRGRPAEFRKPRLAMSVAALLTLAACGGSNQSGVVDGFLGGAVAEEPRAAVVGRDVLAAGGSAADAAVAMYFTLAVTMPTAASLGGGGACLIHDPTSEVGIEALEFLPGQPPRLVGTADVVPGNARGMFALHARFGLLDWQDLVAPAEGFARNGHPLSRATAGTLATVAPAIAADRELAATFMSSGGAPLAEASSLRQIELGAVLTAIRTRGPGAFYGGPIGRQYIDGLPDGSALRLEDLREYRPRFRAPLRYASTDRAIAFLPPPVVGGTVSGQVWGVLDSGAYGGAGVRRAALQVAAARAGAVAVPQWIRRDGSSQVPLEDLIAPPSLAALAGASAATAPAGARTTAADMAAAGTGFVAADLAGQMVACAVTMNRPLGAATTARGTGIVIAAAPDPALPAPVSAMIMVNPNINIGFLAAAAAGPSDLLPPVAYEVVRGDPDPVAALAAPRAVYDPIANAAVVEAGFPASARQALTDAGLAPRDATAAIGRVAVIFCPIGLPRSLQCTFANDPRGPGLAASAD